MAYSFVVATSAASSDGNSVTSSSIDTTGADLLVVVVSDYSAASEGTLSDSKSNTWTKRTIYNDGSIQRTVAYYAKNPTVGSGHTFTVNGTAHYPGIAVAAFSGADTSAPYDTEAGSYGSTSPFAAGSITPSQSDSLVISGAGYWVSGVVDASSINGGFTLASHVAKGVAGFGAGVAYLIQTSAAAANPSWTTSSAVSAWAATNLSFKAAAASSAVKTINGLARASVKTANGLAIASVKKFNGLA